MKTSVLHCIKLILGGVISTRMIGGQFYDFLLRLRQIYLPNTNVHMDLPVHYL